MQKNNGAAMHDFGKIVYLEMQKSGSTYVNNFLKECCLLKEIKHKKHKFIRDDYDSRSFYFITIRNPVDLYSSLYRYGLDGRGGVYKRLEKARKTSCYSTPETFFRFITDPKNAVYVGGGYSEKIAEQIGVMSFRFMKLSLKFPFKRIAAKISNRENLLTLEREFITNLEVKNENLNSELGRLSNKLFPDLFDQEKAKKFLDSAVKINASKHPSNDKLREEIGKFNDYMLKKEALLLSRYSNILTV